MAVFAKELIKADFEKAALHYNEYSSLQKSVAASLIDIASGYINGGKILDVGSGTGFIAENSNWDITQLDIAYQMCKKSQQFSPVTNGDMELLPYADQSFDGLLSSLSLQWSVNPRQVFSQANKVLKEGGYAIFSTFGPDTLKELKQLFKVIEGSGHVSSFLPVSMLHKLASAADFEIVSSKSQIVDSYYPNVRNLLKTIKGVGASNKQDDRKRYFSKSILKDLEETYEQAYATPKGVKATWEVIYLVLRKAK